MSEILTGNANHRAKLRKSLESRTEISGKNEFNKFPPFNRLTQKAFKRFHFHAQIKFVKLLGYCLPRSFIPSIISPPLIFDGHRLNHRTQVFFVRAGIAGRCDVIGSRSQVAVHFDEPLPCRFPFGDQFCSLLHCAGNRVQGSQKCLNLCLRQTPNGAQRSQQADSDKSASR